MTVGARDVWSLNLIRYHTQMIAYMSLPLYTQCTMRFARPDQRCIASALHTNSTIWSLACATQQKEMKFATQTHMSIPNKEKQRANDLFYERWYGTAKDLFWHLQFFSEGSPPVTW